MENDIKNMTLVKYIHYKCGISKKNLYTIYKQYINFVIEQDKKLSFFDKKREYNDKEWNFVKELFPNNFYMACKTFSIFILAMNEYNVGKMRSFSMLCKFKYRYIEKIVGVGIQGVALKINEIIVKILYFKMDPDYTERCIKYFNHDNQHFPKIYHYTDYIICMEYLKTYTKKCRYYDRLLSPYIDNSYYQIIKKDRNFYKTANLSKRKRRVLKWGTEIFNTNIRELYNNDYDMYIDNIGERENGEIVLFDP